MLRTLRCTIACLLLCFTTVANTGDSETNNEEAEFRIQLGIDAPSVLHDKLRGGLNISRWQDYDSMTLPLLQSLLSDARTQALEAAATEGYHNAQVDITIDELHQGVRTVHVKLTPGEPMRVTNVSIMSIGLNGGGDENAEKRVREQWLLVPGEIFRQSAWDAAKNNALTEFARTRYVGATIAESQATVDPVKNSADLKLVLDHGPAFALGAVTVAGLSKYPMQTVTNLASFKSGDPYTCEKSGSLFTST